MLSRCDVRHCELEENKKKISSNSDIVEKSFLKLTWYTVKYTTVVYRNPAPIKNVLLVHSNYTVQCVRGEGGGLLKGLFTQSRVKPKHQLMLFIVYTKFQTVIFYACAQVRWTFGQCNKTNWWWHNTRVYQYACPGFLYISAWSSGVQTLSPDR